jgi:ABC-type molybdate transport system substrate-binding protein
VRKRVALLATFLIAVCVARAPASRTLEFTVPPMDQVLDLHGNPNDAQLVIFAAGNQFMVMPLLLHAFEARHPQITRIYYETLPPGIVVDQVYGGDLRIGNLLLSAKPDVLLAGPAGMRRLQNAGYVHSWTPYASNQLAIMVRKNNPLKVQSLTDLGRNDVRVVMPNPKWEGVAEQVEGAYAKAGGEALVHQIMLAKVANGTTILTRIHHRQTPLYLIESKADAGPVWISEALYAERIGEPLTFVRIPQSENVTAAYDAAVVRDAPHAGVARAFVEFLKTPEARAIYQSFGFGPPHSL